MVALIPPPCLTVGSDHKSRCPVCRDGSARSWAWHTAPSITEFRLRLLLGVGLMTASSRAYGEGFEQTGPAGQRRGLGLSHREPGVQAVLHLLTWGGDGQWP